MSLLFSGVWSKPAGMKTAPARRGAEADVIKKAPAIAEAEANKKTCDKVDLSSQENGIIYTSDRQTFATRVAGSDHTPRMPALTARTLTQYCAPCCKT